jgi:tubulin-specific chaperone C
MPPKAQLLTTHLKAIKGLREKLEETRASFGPRTRFTFKTARKNPSAVSLSDAAELAAQQRRSFHGYQTPSTESSFVNTPNQDRGSSPPPFPVPPPTAVDDSSKDASESEKKERPGLGSRMAGIRRPTFSTSTTVSINHESNAHIILPSSASHASKPCSLTSLKGCVVDISVLSPKSGAPFAGLTVKTVSGSLLVCGVVSGPAHITGVEDSVIVVTCRQFRMHECKNVDVYLSCSSRPIIEDCSGIRFAQLPNAYVSSFFISLDQHIQPLTIC